MSTLQQVDRKKRALVLVERRIEHWTNPPIESIERSPESTNPADDVFSSDATGKVVEMRDVPMKLATAIQERENLKSKLR